MTIRVVQVDQNKPAIAHLLNHLQGTILEGDVPCELNGWWWIAYDDALPIGFAGVMQSNRWTDTGYLCRSGVLPSHRGRGIQKRLIRAREAKARKLKWRWLITDTYKNPASSNSLIRQGYQIFTPSAPWGFDSAIYWRKAL